VIAGAAVTLIGAGPTGALLAILLRRRGIAVTIYELRGDPRRPARESGRSINLALADRGITALRRVGLYADIEPHLVPMPGRLIHDAHGGTALQPYGQRADEVNYSISRQRLNAALVDLAVRRYDVEICFEHRLEAADFGAGLAQVRDLATGRRLEIPMRPLLGCDGAASALRRLLVGAGRVAADERLLDHGYKELTMPALPTGAYAMAREALHIWPRGDHMLIALPNTDGSFTATLFLPNEGPTSFAALRDRAAVDAFLSGNFPDAVALMPNRLEEFAANPTGLLGTVHAAPWSAGGSAALIGDAAHAIVPFHGQGMNCCFEDCLEFDACVARHATWEACFADFYAARKPNTDAIAAMAIENYLEMRAHVADARFRLQHALSLELERRFPDRFIPRYAMVMFHHEIPYALARRRGIVQTRLLESLTEGRQSLAEVDFERARREIEVQLTVIGAALADAAPADSALADPAEAGGVSRSSTTKE
jgi:kynurenine 3-monooxygenase